jgi:threonylcarbamoyladenosine tRNA methylthiotransferase MtaB
MPIHIRKDFIYMIRKAAFLSLGCKVNSYETEAMRNMFEAAGYEIVDFKDIADVYVINTCTVTNIADRKSRQMLHQAKHRNPEAVIAAVGCYVQAAEEDLAADTAVDLIIGNNKKSDIVTLVESCVKYRQKGEHIIDINKENTYEELNVITTMEKTRAFIKIQDGCNRFCSYCIIPYVRGRVRSRGENEILNEVSSLAANGYKEIVLTGIHISSYGIDRTTALNSKANNNFSEKGTEDLLDEYSEEYEADIPLASLIIKIGQIEGIERIRLGSLEPRLITENFLKLVSSVKQFCPHFHLSLQSGSDTVLKRMNRRYTSGEYLDKVNLIKRFYELPAFTTDVIVGFPGETEDEFEQTMEFVKKVGFSHIHVFKYSKRAGTKAAIMQQQIPEDVKNVRSNKLIALAEMMSSEYKSLFMGRIEKILIEEEIVVDGIAYQTGHNERYLKLAVQSDIVLTNDIIKVRVCKILTKDTLLCEITN